MLLDRPGREIGLLPFTRCRHLHSPAAIKHGCSIYSHRPMPCRLWSCRWLENSAWPDELRPDRCGVVFDPVIDLVKIGGKELPAAQAWVTAGHEEDWRKPPCSQVITVLLDRGLVVLWRLPYQEGVTEPKAVCIAQNRMGVVTASEPSPATYELGSDEERLDRAQELMAQRRRLGGTTRR